MEMRDESTTNTHLHLIGEFPGTTCDELFAYWITPELLQRWWPPVAEIEARLGGSYHLAWPDRQWHLRGLYTTFEPGRALAFSWRWDHEPAGTPDREVHVTFEAVSGEVRMGITHGPYGISEEEQQVRAGHLEGWLYFTARLAASYSSSREAPDAVL